LVWVAVALLGLGLLAAWVLILQVLGQQGRLLLRLESLEEQLAFDGHPEVTAEPQGLPVGAAVPAFRLPDVSGQPVGLEDFRGRRVLLVQWSLTCGFCEQLAPELADLQPQLRTHDVQPVLVSSGDPKANRRMARRHGLDCPVLLQPDGEQVEAFKGLGTPVAYLVDQRGRVAAPLAVGAKQVPRLARQALNGQPHGDGERRRLPGQRPLSHSRIKRDGLEPGSPAPEFTLPGVDGPQVSLAAFRGRRVLLVFSDPHCDPCNQLTPELVRLHRQVGQEQDGLAVVMVSRGDRAENQRKCQQHQVQFPVGLQPGWQLSRRYGIFSTPVAFLINEDGVIAERVALGADAILALARGGRAAGEEAPMDVSG
jgi:peroxiredoxin